MIAEHFQADYSSMLLDELGAVDSAVEGIERFKAFFGAADRKKKFVKLMPNAQTKEDIALGAMSDVAALLRGVALLGEQLAHVHVAEVDAHGAVDETVAHGVGLDAAS